jgi:hypothetical protein
MDASADAVTAYQDRIRWSSYQASRWAVAGGRLTAMPNKGGRLVAGAATR